MDSEKAIFRNLNKAMGFSGCVTPVELGRIRLGTLEQKALAHRGDLPVASIISIYIAWLQQQKGAGDPKLLDQWLLSLVQKLEYYKADFMKTWNAAIVKGIITISLRCDVEASMARIREQLMAADGKKAKPKKTVAIAKKPAPTKKDIPVPNGPQGSKNASKTSSGGHAPTSGSASLGLTKAHTSGPTVLESLSRQQAPGSVGHDDVCAADRKRKAEHGDFKLEVPCHNGISLYKRLRQELTDLREESFSANNDLS
jgi:hypothetical protein